MYNDPSMVSQQQHYWQQQGDDSTAVYLFCLQQGGTRRQACTQSVLCINTAVMQPFSLASSCEYMN
jgi:hypothetical protein